MAKLIIQNLATEYKDEGKGNIILCLHGWQDSLRTFDNIVKNLSKDYRIIRLDLPGFGNTEKPKESWGVGEYALFVRDFINKLDIKPDYLLGHSFGGRIILKGQTEYNLEAKKNILIASAGISETKTLRNMIFKTLAKLGGLLTYVPPLIFWREDLRRMLYKFLRSDYMESEQLKKTFLKVIREDLSNNAKRINKPTLLIWGNKDIVTPLSDGKKLNKLISDSRIEIVDGVGHFVHKKESEKVSDIIKKFLSYE